MRPPILVIFTAISSAFLIPAKLSGQDITGTWESIDRREYYKLVVIQKGDSLFGYTYDTGMGYCKANFMGTYDSASKKLKGTNTSFIEKTPAHSLCNYKLYYSKRGEEEYLTGAAYAKKILTKVLSMGLPMSTKYKKVSTAADTTAFMAQKVIRIIPVSAPALLRDSVNSADRAAPDLQNADSLLTVNKEQRKSTIIHSIETNADSIRIVLHDNGEIDNDTVTVFLNGKIIINRLGLGIKGYEKVIPIDRTTEITSIELMANNLGSIPPNTAYLTIYAGKEKYELRSSSDFEVNARIDIRAKRKE